MTEEAMISLLLRLDALIALLLDEGVITEDGYLKKWDEILTIFAVEVESEIEEMS